MPEYSASATPRTTRVPQNGGVGSRLSTVTSERSGSGPATSASAALRLAATRWDRSWRALRSAFLASSAGSTSGSSPRTLAIVASISRRPSKASRA